MDPTGAAQAAPQHRAQQIHFQKFCPENVQHNDKQLYYIRSVFTAVAGSAAGLLGLVNLRGFYFYLASVLLVNLAIFFINLRTRPSQYLMRFNAMEADPTAETQNGFKDKASHVGSGSEGKTKVVWPYVTFLFDGAQEMAFGYVLWWTLWTALIHVFD